MRYFLKLTLLIAVTAAVSACNPFGDSDPLAKQPDSVKNGEVPNKPVKDPDPLDDEDVLLVDFTPGGYTFREGVETEITITGRSMFTDSLYEMRIENMQEFKDATVTAVAGDKLLGIQPTLTFKWKPPVGYVFGDKLKVSLEVFIFTTNHANPYSRTVNVPIWIYNEAFAVPKITAVTGLPQKIKESALASKFRVEIEDYESRDVAGERPALLFLSKTAGVNLAPFIKVDKTTLLDSKTGRWYFDVSINTSGIELTNSSHTGYFDIVTISANSVQSNPYNVVLPVWTSVMEPMTTWTEKIVFKIGAMNTFSFTVLDPKSEGKMSVDFSTSCSSLSTQSAPSCACSAVASGSVGKPQSTFVCTIQWDVSPNELPSDKTIFYRARNTSPVATDTDYKELGFQGTIQLIN